MARLAALMVTELSRGRFDLVKAATLGTVDYFRGRLGRGSMSLVQELNAQKSSDDTYSASYLGRGNDMSCPGHLPILAESS